MISKTGERYIWKRLQSPGALARFSAVAGVVAYLKSRGIHAAGPIPTKSGRLTCTVSHSVANGTVGLNVGIGTDGNGKVGYLQPWLNGKHVDLAERTERLEALSTISAMHLATPVGEALTQGMPSSPVEYPLPSLLAERLHKKHALLRSMWPRLIAAVPAARPLFDIVFAGVDAALSAVSPFPELGRSVMRRCWCHRDLAPHNMLWDGHSVALIDFDLAAPDDPLGDVAQVCNHALALGVVSGSEWMDMAHYYAESTNLSQPERTRLWHLLRFPDTLARAVSDWAQGGFPMDFPQLQRALDCEWTRAKWTESANGE